MLAPQCAFLAPSGPSGDGSMDRRDVLRSCWERRGRAQWLPQVERPPSAPERPGSIGYLQGKPRSPSGCAAASSASPALSSRTARSHRRGMRGTGAHGYCGRPLLHRALWPRSPATAEAPRRAQLQATRGEGCGRQWDFEKEDSDEQIWHARGVHIMLNVRVNDIDNLLCELSTMLSIADVDNVIESCSL